MCQIFKKQKTVIFYLVFGFLTTLVNVLFYFVFTHVLDIGVEVSTVFSWIVSVFFAYVTNRTFVFESKAKSVPSVIKEIMFFFASRFVTGLLDFVIMLLLAEWLLLNDVLVKIVSNIIVIVLNYIAGKFFVFKKKK